MKYTHILACCCLAIAMSACGKVHFSCHGFFVSSMYPIRFSGAITRIYKDTSQHYVSAIEIQDTELKQLSQHHVSEMHPLWDHASLGDTLIKRPNSLEYQLRKPDTTLYFYPYCVEAHEIGAVENPNFKEEFRRFKSKNR